MLTAVLVKEFPHLIHIHAAAGICKVDVVDLRSMLPVSSSISSAELGILSPLRGWLWKPKLPIESLNFPALLRSGEQAHGYAQIQHGSWLAEHLLLWLFCGALSGLGLKLWVPVSRQLVPRAP